MSAKTYTYGKTYTLTANAFNKTDYKFNGWDTRADGTGTKYADKASVKNLTASAGKTITLYAQWVKYYKVAFNANGGTGTMSTQSIIYGKSTALTANTFKCTGYTFAGWNTNADGTGKAYADKASVKNLTSTAGKTVTLYAQWKKG